MKETSQELKLKAEGKTTKRQPKQTRTIIFECSSSYTVAEIRLSSAHWAYLNEVVAVHLDRWFQNDKHLAKRVYAKLSLFFVNLLTDSFLVISFATWGFGCPCSLFVMYFM